MKKALGVDVDGVICPITDHDDELADAGFLPVPGVEVWYHPDHGRMLTEFAAEHDFELVWCTYWGEGANEILSPLLGIEPWPVIDFEASDLHGYLSTWKYDAVARWADGRPFAWLDDEHEHPARWKTRSAFLQGRTAPTKLVTVKRELGLLKCHLDEIAEWSKMIEQNA